jgi:ferredoxin-NADP reductase
MQDIFSSEHTGKIYLFHEVDTLADLYLTDELSEISDYYPNFQYIPCVLQSSQNNTAMTSANQRIRHTVTDLIGGQAFICGSKHFVLSIQKQSYLAGCNTNDIFVDITT